MKLSLQTFTPYDESIKWDIQKNYYLKRGADAWLKGEVPYDVTSNSYAAYQMATLLYQTIKEMEKNKQLKKDEKINVMELASGVGLFAINFVKQFEMICTDNKVNYFERFQYFFSDFSEKNLQEAAKNASLRELEKKGKIIFTIVDALNPTKIKRLRDGKMIDNIKLAGIFANYAHDVLPLTVLRKKGTKFYEKNIALSIETEEMSKEETDKYKKDIITNPVNTEIMNKLIEEEKYVPVDEKKLDPIHKKIMQEATEKFPVATIVYPHGSFKAIKEALPLLQKGGFYIISDKGYADEYYMEGERTGEPSIHGNSFAHSLNFPLIERYAQKTGLFTSRTSNPDYSLQTIIITKEKNKSLKEVFDNLFITNNLNEESSDLSEISRQLEDNKKFGEAAVVVKQVLRIRKCDANIYYHVGYLFSDIGNATEALNYFTEGQKYDYFNLYNFELEIGIANFNLGNLKEALAHYKKSIQLFGTSRHVLYNIGLCYAELKDYPSAKKYFLKSLAIDKTYQPARDKLVEVLLQTES